MTDRLESVVQIAGPLLRRIDHVLAAGGAPPDHPVWAELRRVKLLPGDAVVAVVALRPAEFTEVVPALRRQARACATIATDLPLPHLWRGDAADAYAASRTRVADHLSGGRESLDERLAATAGLAEAMADWMHRTRRRTAAAVTEILTSTEAVRLATGPGAGPAAESAAGPAAVSTQLEEARAAAAMAVPVLRAIGDSYAEGADLLQSSDRLAVSTVL